MTINDRIKIIRKDLKLSQKDLAKKWVCHDVQ